MCFPCDSFLEPFLQGELDSMQHGLPVWDCHCWIKRSWCNSEPRGLPPFIPPPGSWIHWEHNEPLSVPSLGAYQRSYAVKPGKTVSKWIWNKGLCFKDQLVPLLGVLAAVRRAVVVGSLEVSVHDSNSWLWLAPALLHCREGRGLSLCLHCSVQYVDVWSSFQVASYRYMSYVHGLVGEQ